MHYAADRDLWYCDIDIRTDPARVGADAAYRPFVHLALARYQQHSVDGAELSPVVMLDWAQLAPDRAVTLLQDPARPGAAQVTVAGHTYDTAGASTLQVVVQERRADRPDELGWVTLGGEQVAAEVGAGTQLLWRGSVQAPIGAGRGPFRVVVHEFEPLPSDDGIGRRTVFLDALELG